MTSNLNVEVTVEKSNGKVNVQILLCFVGISSTFVCVLQMAEVTECSPLRSCFAENSTQPDEETVHAGKFGAPLQNF